MELHKVGNCVEIGEKLIPAVNIQVEGVPGYLEHRPTGEKAWYGIYFEVLFEGGEFWVVEKGFKNNIGVVQWDGVWVEEYDSKDRKSDLEPNYAWYLPSWEAFLDGYEVKTLSKYPTTWRHLLGSSVDAS
jgi:hypothetical protein